LERFETGDISGLNPDADRYQDRSKKPIENFFAFFFTRATAHFHGNVKPVRFQPPPIPGIIAMTTRKPKAVPTVSCFAQSLSRGLTAIYSARSRLLRAVDVAGSRPPASLTANYSLKPRFVIQNDRLDRPDSRAGLPGRGLQYDPGTEHGF